jgi:glutamate/tyrosine decarboxylase-like PLP-dependent enzyme
MSDPMPQESGSTVPTASDPLAVTPARMREMAAAIVELLAEEEAELRARPMVRRASPEELAEHIAAAPPEQGRPFEQVLDELRANVLPFGSRLGHPAYFAYIPGNSTFPGALGDLTASVLNIEASNWMDSSGLAQLELTILGWFAEWIGYPAAAAGILVSGGSAANLTALACARESLVGPMQDDLVVYASDQSHSGKRWLASIERADSITLDPHKWLYQPFECGCVLVREGRLLEDAFRIGPDYLKDARGAEVDFADRGLQLSRMARSLKLWLSIQTFGIGAFREAIDRALDLAELAEHLVGESEELELMRPARWGSSAFVAASAGTAPRPRPRH